MDSPFLQSFTWIPEYAHHSTSNGTRNVIFAKYTIDLLNQIQQALNQNLYYVALMMCLTIPDICGAIDSPNGIASGAAYARWYNQYAASHCPYLDGPTCYQFRCSMLHQGSTTNPNSRYSRIVFVEPGSTNSVLHCNVMNRALNLDVGVFCSAIITGAQNWLSSASNNPLFQTNYNNFVRRYPNGLPPYIIGVPVIS